MINVTKTYLPPLDDYITYLEGIWQRGQLTNAGPLVLELESRLKEILGVRHLLFLNNGTVALQLAIQALALSGEIITTPFSYVATTASIVWEKCKPVFVDIDSDSLCINPDLIEASITKYTQAILATHVYGNACDISAIEAIAVKHNLKVIYDAAHAFGVSLNDKSLLSYGDVSTVSFHATKLFHTIEGGAVITNNDIIGHRLSYMRNFGHKGPEDFWDVGINGKNSEIHAAMGLCILPHLTEIIASRRELTELYDNLLLNSACRRPVLSSCLVYNYAYYPIIMPSEKNF